MSSLRMTSDLRRQLILSAAKRCFSRHGFAGTTTKSVAAAAAISEALLFKHFPSKAALYAEILAEECEADPDLAHLLGQEPSTATLVELVRGMVGHFLEIANGPDEEEAQRLRLMTTSYLDDGEFARLLYAKVADLIGPVFNASLDRAVAAGDASRVGDEPLNLFWFAHHTVLMAALSRLPTVSIWRGLLPILLWQFWVGQRKWSGLPSESALRRLAYELNQKVASGGDLAGRRLSRHNKSSTARKKDTRSVELRSR